MRSRVEEIFHEVADLTAEERTRYFARHRINTTTVREVEELISLDADSSVLLERDISHVAQRALARFERSGLLCGSYKLTEFLGRGGMGTVYLAERVDGEVAQCAAVKLLPPGSDDPHLRRRFLAERQILAGLSHPNIARLLDAGHREDGQPYLVMEYVNGKAVDHYTRDLSLRQKLSLFLKVCSAVSYLHQNLVVHRDLKPANILVTQDGEPKLLDFGIAKILALTDESTWTGMRMLTPDYASPEQVVGDPVSTATDIYSLGAVLYKLLTGRSPHEIEGQSARPFSLRLADWKPVPPARIVPGLKGDLESILLKALRWEPRERYSTVEQFSEDLENYLESRPVRARKGDTWYRMRKFVRRYWLPVAAGTLAVAGLSAGLLVAEHQRAIAQQRFLQVRKLANRLFDIDSEVRRTPGTTKARQLIVETSLEYLRPLAGDSRGDPELALEIGNAYMRVARVQGVPISTNLGQMDHAGQNLRIAEDFVHSVLARQPSNRMAMLRAAQIAHDRMLLERFGNHFAEALVLARQAAQWLEKFNAGKNDSAEGPSILSTYWNVADQLMLAEQYDDALRLCRRAGGIAVAVGRPAYLGTLLETSAEVYRRRGDLEEALKEIREGVGQLNYGSGVTDQGVAANYVLGLMREGRILGEVDGISLGRPEEAAVPLERAFQIADDFAHRDPNDQTSRGRLAKAGLMWARILRRSDVSRSLAVYDHMLLHLGEVENNSSFRRFEVSARAGSSYALLLLGRFAEAKQRLDASAASLREMRLYPDERIRPGSEPDEMLCALANYQAVRGDLPRAIEIYEELLRKVLAWEPKPVTSLSDAVDVSRIYAALADLDRRAGHSENAATMEASRQKLWQHWSAAAPGNSFVRRQLDAVRRRL